MSLGCAPPIRPALLGLTALLVVGFLGQAASRPDGAVITIRIREVDGRSGRPIRRDTVGVYINHGKYPILGKLGEGGEATVVFRTVGKGSVISVSPGDYYDCRPTRYKPFGVAYALGISYSLRIVIQRGIVAENTCGSAEARAVPGTIVIFVKPLSLWQRLRQ